MLNMERERIMNGNLKITVEKVRVEGSGVILLMGPSGCGKGEIAKKLCKLLSIPDERHLSMGSILRETVIRAKEDFNFKYMLAAKYNISHDISITNNEKNGPEVVEKAQSYYNDVKLFFGTSYNFISQFDWLEFCVANGLLIPDEWTEWTEMIIDALLENSTELHKSIFILDGYPRTVTAAERLLKSFERFNIPIIKVIHLF
jgi:adenylate kinase family enzyme